MAVYKRGPLGIELPSLGESIIPLVIVAGIIALLWIGFTTPSTVIEARVLQNPLFLSTEDSTILQIKVSNPLPEPLYNVPVSATASGSRLLSIYPSGQTIPSLGPQETRVLEFLINPIDPAGQPFLPGTYRIDVKTTIANMDYQTSVTIQVAK